MSLLLTLTLTTLVLSSFAAPFPPCRHSARSPAVQSPNNATSTNSNNTNTNTNNHHSPLPASLFPINNILQSWSTSDSTPNPLPLNTNTFHPTNLISSIAPKYVPAPDGKQSLQAHYSQGSFTLGHSPLGGFSFYAPGPPTVDLSTAKEATLGYTLLFQPGFDFHLGGKLPGFYGGTSNSEAIGCSGGRRSDSCFSARLMWRSRGKGEIYTYLPPSSPANQAVCSVKPFSTCNPTYGASVGRGSFDFVPGQRIAVSERVRLNDVGQSNGQLELFVNGNSVINVGGLVLRNSDQGRIRGIQMQTFFGGHTAVYASPKSQDAYFSDFSVAITEKL